MTSGHKNLGRVFMHSFPANALSEESRCEGRRNSRKKWTPQPFLSSIWRCSACLTLSCPRPEFFQWTAKVETSMKGNIGVVGYHVCSLVYLFFIFLVCFCNWSNLCLHGEIWLRNLGNNWTFKPWNVFTLEVYLCWCFVSAGSKHVNSVICSLRLIFHAKYDPHSWPKINFRH